MLRDRRQQQHDFLIGEEPLEGDVGFFAPSADAGPRAAADTVAETTLGMTTGFLPPGRNAERGSAIPRASVRRHRLAGAVALASCGAAAAIVALLVLKAQDVKPSAAAVEGRPARIDRGDVGASPTGGRSARAVPARRHAPMLTTRNAHARARTRRSAAAVPGKAHKAPDATPPIADSPRASSSSAVGPDPVAAETVRLVPRGEFEFER